MVAKLVLLVLTHCLNAIGNVLGANLFAYCRNNPVMGIDPTGTFYISFGTMGIILLAIGINPVGATLIGIGVSKLTQH